MSAHAQPRVAIVMRTKDRPVLLRRALASALAQTFTDFTLVIVNDAGDRGVVEEVVAEIAGDDDRIKVVHNATSSGREGAMNDGLRASHSEFIVIHDDDDSWDENFLGSTVDYLDGQPQDDAVAARTEVVHEKVTGEQIETTGREILAADVAEISLSRMLARNYAPPISVLYRRSVHDHVGEYDASLPVLADWDFMLRLLMRGSAGFIDGPPLAYWHHRADATGDLGNSVIADRDDHAHYERVIRDRYLRKSLEDDGSLGIVLYLAGQLDVMQRTIEATMEAARQGKVGQLRQMWDSRLHEANSETRKLAAEIRELNRNLVSQNNRFIAQMGRLQQETDELRNLVYSQTPRARVRSYARVARNAVRRLTR